MVTKKNPPFGGRRGTVTFEVACVQQINCALSCQEKSGQLNEPTETRLNRRPRVAELTAAQSEVPPSGSAPRLGVRGADGCPEQLQLTHTALWSGPQSVKV